MTACSWGHLDCVNLLIAHGADVKEVNAGTGCVSMHYAAEGGHIDVIRLLVQNGADGTQKDAIGWTRTLVLQ